VKLTKYAHACVTFADGDRTLLVDPGAFTPGTADLLAAADAVLITHEHFDHFDDGRVAAALDQRPDLRVYGPAGVVEKLGERDGRVVAVKAGDRIEAAGFDVSVHGEQHAVIHADIPLIDNVGFLVEGRVYHPGDSYDLPGVPVETLLLPTSGPWTKLGETADFVRAVRPSRLIQIHELLLSDLGQQSAQMFLGEEGLTGLPLEILPQGEDSQV
jgi:L-ascorbate metabolism protein UlaG (beta-lactamase superfamily)